MLKFVGTGSAFNTELGNNSAFIKEGENLFLIDCGGTVFERLKNKGILNDVKNIKVMITHTHPDHIGSLGDLIFYTYYFLKGNVEIFHKEKDKISSILNLLGVNQSYYVVNDNEKIYIENMKIHLEIIKASHSKSLNAFSCVIEYNDEKSYYSGDSNVITDYILERFKARDIKYIYQDTCGKDYDGNAHLYIGKIADVIDESLRPFVTCMHIDQVLSDEDFKKYDLKKAENI